jgi:Holin of 3TMs, for gene-transfer release
MSLDPITAGIDLARTAVNAIWPDKTEQEKAQLAAAVALTQGQLAINQVEAASPSLYVAGWRPFIGWTCGLACAWNWIGLSIAAVVLELFGRELELQPLDLSQMWPVLIGMLGIGALRTVEKVKGVA